MTAASYGSREHPTGSIAAGVREPGSGTSSGTGTIAINAGSVFATGDAAAVRAAGIITLDAQNSLNLAIVKPEGGAVASVNGENYVCQSGGTTVAKEAVIGTPHTITATAQVSENGTVSADKATAVEGETVTLTVAPHDGYGLESIAVLDKDGYFFCTPQKESDIKYTFTMPAENVSIRAVFAGLHSVTVDFGADHAAFVNTHFGNNDKYAVNEAKISFSAAGSNRFYLQGNAENEIRDCLGDAIYDNNDKFCGIGLKPVSGYSSQREYDNEKDLGYSDEDAQVDNRTFYAVWFRPVTNVEVTVTPPSCGTAVTWGEQGGAPKSDPTPDIIVSGGMHLDSNSDILFTTWSWYDGTGKYNSFIGGQTYPATFFLGADWGYYIPDDFDFARDMTIKGGVLDGANSPTHPQIYISVLAVHVDENSDGKCDKCEKGLHTIIVTQPTNGTVTTSATVAAADDAVQLTVTPDEGYVLNSLTVKKDADGAGVSVTDNAFIMPDSAVTVTATFRQPGSGGSGSGGSGGGTTAYKITTDVSGNGTVTASKIGAAEGETITLTATPDDGWTLDSLSAADKNGTAVTLTEQGDGTYTFTMPASTVAVTAAFKESEQPPEPIPGSGFDDVPDNAWYKDAVDWAVANGITSGKDETHFAPRDPCSRAQMLTFLWRAMGEPEPASTDNPFTDVPDDAYYTKAVLWAAEMGITSGVTPTTFGPKETVGRGQCVTFLYRLMGENEMSLPFVDVNSGAYYFSAVLWAVKHGITTGKDETHFAPKAPCTRAEIVTFLYRAMAQ